MDTPTLIADPSRGKSTLEQAAAQFSREAGAAANSPWARNTSLSQSRYRSLREDSDQQFVSPLLELNAHPQLAVTMESAAQKVLGTNFRISQLQIKVPPAQVRLSLFDNTMGVIEWGLEVDGPEAALTKLLAKLDVASFMITEAGVRHAQDHLLVPAMRAIDKAFRDHESNDRRMSKALLRPARFRVFFDVADILGRAHALKGWPTAGDDTGLLWVSRVLVGRPVGRDLAAAVSRWRGALPDALLDDNIGLNAEVGNSIFVCEQGSKGLGDVADSYRKAQYIYSMLDVHARNITLLYAQFLARREKVASHTLASLDAIQSHVDYIDMQLIDVYNGLQSSRHDMVAQLRKTWQLDDKLRELVRKCDAARRRVESLVHTRSLRYQKMVQFILGGVGVLALADLLINLAAFSHAEEADSGHTWGLLRFVQAASPDFFVTTSILGSCILLLLVALFIRKG